ncbi:MAG: LysR family transcriptional regulator [Coriobacteriia bacterium]
MLADCLNFHTAADRLFITQPVLSRHLAALEHEMGGALFSRTTRHVELTEMGDLLLPDARAIVDQYGSMLAKIRMRQHAATLRLGGFIRHEQVLPVLSTAMNRFQAKYPWVQTYEKDLAAADHTRMLLDDTFDLMLSPHLEQPDDGRFEYHDLFRLPLRVWLTKGNCLARCKKLSLRDLETQTLRFLSLGEGDEWDMWQAHILQLFTEKGASPKVGPPTNVSLALSDTEYALVPSSVTRAYGDNVVSVDLDERHYIVLSIIHKRATGNPALPLFVAEILKAHGELMPVHSAAIKTLPRKM